MVLAVQSRRETVKEKCIFTSTGVHRTMETPKPMSDIATAMASGNQIPIHSIEAAEGRGTVSANKEF